MSSIETIIQKYITKVEFTFTFKNKVNEIPCIEQNPIYTRMHSLCETIEENLIIMMDYPKPNFGQF